VEWAFKISMKNKTQFILLFFVIGILLPFANTTTLVSVSSQQGTEINLPKKVELNTVLTADVGNDIYFTTNADNAIIDNAYTSSSSSFRLFRTDVNDKYARSNMGLFNPLVDVSNIFLPNSLYHASNRSAANLDLMYTATYYDLTGGSSGLNKISNTVLFQGEAIGFQFEADADIPLILDLKIKGQANIMKLNIYMITPSGMLYDYSAINNDFYTFVNQFIPLVPDEDGLYTVYLVAPNNDIILEHLQLFHDPPTVGISSGYTARWQGTETQTLFFNIASNSTNDLEIMSLVSTVFYNESVSSPDQLLGRLSLDYFTPTTGPFGGKMPATVVNWQDSSLYVAVTATPPNDQNPFVKATKSELGLPEGFDVEYAFWAQSFEVEDFTPNVDVRVPFPTNTGQNRYYWSTTQEYILGMNHTDAGTAFIYDLDDPTKVYSLDSNANNILEVESHSGVILPEGNYMIHLLSGFSTFARISTFTPISLSMGSTNNYVFDLDKPVFFKLPATLPGKESLNFTYLDGVNASVTLEMTMYNGRMTHLQDSPYLFENYWAAGPTPQFDNTTLFGNTNINNHYNLHQGFVRVNAISNTKYNPDGGVNSTNIPDLQPLFSIKRENYLNIWQSDTTEHTTMIYNSGFSDDINGSKSTVIYLFQFATASSFTGYNFRFTTTNATFTVLTFLDWTTTWTSPGETLTTTVIGGINHYSYVLEFGTTQLTNLAILLVLSPANNGTFSTQMNTVLVQQTPKVSLGSLSTALYIPPYEVPTNGTEDDNGNQTNFLRDNQTAFIIGGAVAGVAAIGAVTFVLLKRRGA
jgi:hypothetical protein